MESNPTEFNLTALIANSGANVRPVYALIRRETPANCPPRKFQFAQPPSLLPHWLRTRFPVVLNMEYVQCSRPGHSSVRVYECTHHIIHRVFNRIRSSNVMADTSRERLNCFRFSFYNL